MPQNSGGTLWDSLTAAEHRPDRFLCGADATVMLGDLARGSSLCGRLEELRDCSVLIVTKDQLTTALALIELDGIARRLVLCLPDLPMEHLPAVIEAADIDALVYDDGSALGAVASGIRCVVACTPTITPVDSARSAGCQTEWILLTSGTTGLPKMVLHTLSSLAGAIARGTTQKIPVIWGTFYDIRRFGGLQIFLRAILGGSSLALSSAQESTADFLARVGKCGVTHISGTPSHWRGALMGSSARRIAPRYIRMSGEIADQAILDSLRAFYPETGIAHAFASTEAGVAFEVGDGLEGFPARLIGQPGASVELKIEDGSLRIRSARTATRYLGGASEPLADKDGFVDTRDMVELRGDRYYFVGRRDGVINVGGLKVHPEEVEAVINRHPGVRMSLVKARKNPFTGAVVVADVVAKSKPDQSGAKEEPQDLKNDILQICRRALAPHKVPAIVRFVPSLNVGPSGKLARFNA